MKQTLEKSVEKGQVRRIRPTPYELRCGCGNIIHSNIQEEAQNNLVECHNCHRQYNVMLKLEASNIRGK